MNEPLDDSTTQKNEWISFLGNLVKYGGPHGALLAEKEYQERVKEVVQTLQLEGACLVDVVRLLGAYLVTEDDVPRSRAISFLADMILQAPSMVERREDVHYLAEFFSSRLVDWPALHGALQGCYAIIMSDKVEEDDAVDMLQTLNDGVYVRSLSAKDRSLALRVIHKIVSKHGIRALDAEIDLAELIIVSIDGEKDPLCLMDGFKAAQVVLQTFESLGEQSVHWGMIEAASEEMFDILSCYFPVSFTPSEHDQSITRDDIAVALELTLLSWRGFHSSVLDIVEEKMSSIVKQAKKDSIHMLQSLVSQNHGVLVHESRRIWTMLRPELMMALLDGKDYPPSFQSAEDLGIGGDALECLSKCLDACHGREHAMASVVLSDVSLTDALTCLNSVGEDEDAFSRSVGSVRASSIIMQACSRAGGEVWSMCLEQNGAAILDIVNTTENLESTCFAYILMYSMLVDAGHLSPCRLQKENLNIVESILAKSVAFDTLLAACAPDKSSLWLTNNQFMWSRERSAYNQITTVMSQIKLCQILMDNDCFEALWNSEKVDALIDGCVSAIMSRPRDDAFLSGINESLYIMCGSNIGKSHNIGNKLMKPLLQALESNECTASLAHGIFSIIAPICRDDVSIRPVVLTYIMERLLDSSQNDSPNWQHLVRGLVVLEGHFSDNPEASHEEIGVLKALLGTRCQSLPCSGEQFSDIVEVSYHISRRSSQEDQLRLMEANVPSSMSCGLTVSHFAGLGCIIGLRKEAVTSVTIHTKTLVEVCVDLLVHSHDENHLKWLSIVVASVMNKMYCEQDRLVRTALEDIRRLALESDQLVNDIDRWKTLRVCFQALAKQGGALESPLDQMCLLMYTSESSRCKVYTLLHSLLEVDKESQWISTESHAFVSFLWHQKAYTIAKRCIQTHAPVIEDGIMKLAMIHLISAAPTAIIQNDYIFVGEQICEFLGHTSYIHEIISDNMVLENVLTVFKSLVCTSEKSRNQIADHLSTMLPNVLFIARNSQFGNTRKIALECLESLAINIPYQSLHAHRHEVLQTTMAACDDMKRHVRLAAAHCRELWSQ